MPLADIRRAPVQTGHAMQQPARVKERYALMNFSKPYMLAAMGAAALIVIAGLYFFMRSGTPTAVAETKPAGACKPSGTYKIEPGDIIKGSNDAPVTLIEYASMTCGHCAAFHRDVLPKLESDFIDKGHVRYVFREFPLDNIALAASVLTRCVSQDGFHPFVSMLFSEQLTWIKASNPKDALQEVSRRAGLTGEEFEKCLANKPIIESVRATAIKGESTYCITGTPTGVLNGRKLDVATIADYEKLSAAIRDELKKLGKPLPEAQAPATEPAVTPAAAGTGTDTSATDDVESPASEKPAPAAPANSGPAANPAPAAGTAAPAGKPAQ